MKRKVSEATVAVRQTAEKKQAAMHEQILFAVGIALLLYVAWQVRVVLEMVYVSALFAVVLTPVVRWIMKLRMRFWRIDWSPGRGSAVALLLVSSVLVLGVFFLTAMPPAFHDMLTFLSEVPTRAPDVLYKLSNLPIADHMNLTALSAQTSQAATAMAKYMLSSLPGWAGAVGEVLTAMVLTIYFMLEGDHAYLWFLSLVPMERRERLNETLLRAEVRMGKWLLGQVTLMLILGVSSTIVFGLLGVRYFYLLGALMGLANIVPVAGAVVTVGLAAVVAALDSWEKMVGVLIFYAIYANFENAYLTPRIMRTRVNLAGLAVLIALLIGSALAGIVGALVSVPTAALVAVLMDEYVVHHDGKLAELIANQNEEVDEVNHEEQPPKK